MEKKSKGEGVHPSTLIGVVFGFLPRSQKTPETGYRITKARVCRKYLSPRLLITIRLPSQKTIEMDYKTLIDYEKEGRILWQNRDPDLQKVKIPEPATPDSL